MRDQLVPATFSRAKDSGRDCVMVFEPNERS
jgi:hypothetical protein